MSVDWDKFNEVGGEMTDSSWPEKGQELAVGDSVEGRYVAKKENIGVNKSNIYVLETADGDKVGVWGSTVIDRKFESISIGTVVAIEYAGEKTGKKGAVYKDFKVGVGMDYVGDGRA